MIGHRGNQIDRLPLGVEPDDGGLASRCIASRVLAVVPETCFITPVNLGILCLRSGVNRRVFFVQPTLDLSRALLIGLLLRLLNGKTPTLEILAHGANGEFQARDLLNQLLHCFTGPQGVAQLELVGCLVDQLFLDHRFLLLGHSPTGTFPAPSSSSLQSLGAAILILLDPAPNGKVMDTDLLPNLTMGISAGFPHPYGLFAFFLLGRGRKGACVFIHVAILSYLYGCRVNSNKDPRVNAVIGIVLSHDILLTDFFSPPPQCGETIFYRAGS